MMDGDSWSYKMCKAPVKSSPLTNQCPASYRLDALSVAQTILPNTEGKPITLHRLGQPNLNWGSFNLLCDN